MTDPIELAQRLGGLLEDGRRVATYKLATLLAMLDACAEAEIPPQRDEAFTLSILDLADRVIDLYWPQVRPYADVAVLRQSTQDRAIILQEVAALRGLGPNPGAVREHPSYARVRRKIAHTLARQPLPALQTPGGQTFARTAFLYDDSWLSYNVTLTELDARDWALELLPGVADGLVRLSTLVRPVIERAWAKDVARLNHLDREYQDLPLFLFGAERSSLVRAAAALRELEGPRCFYCRETIPGTAQVDHFLPWARVPFNGLANLVLTDSRCNGAKSDTLAAPVHRQRWERRDRDGLEQLGADLRWPAEWERSQRIARGLYTRLPSGTPLWEAVKVYQLSL